VTHFAADSLENAAAEGARQRRSARQQLDHWARVGRAASSRHSAARRKVEAALASELELAGRGITPSPAMKKGTSKINVPSTP
jgi:ParD-like antitoxin of type II bacterial toxin-antitoxin system